MKLDVSCMRYLTKDEYRVLTAVEMGMKNHDVVPVELIISIAKLRHGGVQKFLSTLLRFKLIYHDRTTYNGYRLTYGGYDILALKTLLARGHIAAVGMKIGVGKESDIYLAQTDSGEEVVLKLHRLGRVSFRNVKNKRDYLLHRKSASWLYMSRLAALREFAFMKALHMNGFPTPTPIDQNRHVVLMSKVDGFPMYQVKQGNMTDPERVFRICVDLIVRLAKRGLIHCDFNEFNLMISETGDVTLIDFPQMVSTAHVNAKEYFERDVGCVVKFFAMKMRFDPPEDDIPDFDELVGDSLKRGGLDEAVRASGWNASQQEEERLLAAWERVRLARGEDGEDDSESEDEEENEDSEDVEGDEVDRETRGRHAIDERDDGDEEKSGSDVDDEALLDHGDEIAAGAGGDHARK